MSTLIFIVIIYPKLLQSVRNKMQIFWLIFCNILLWIIPHLSCSVLLSFSLIGLSLFTWHCPSRHRTSPQRSHLPNRHIHSLQKCQADKVSNPMPNFVFCFCFCLLPENMSSVCQVRFVVVLVPLLFTRLHSMFRSFSDMLRWSYI